MSRDAGTKPFWRTKTLAQMSQTEWESLCDGCGQCCLHKVVQDDGSTRRTNVSCRLLDTDTCRCRNYQRRKRIVRDCIVLTPDNVPDLHWLPDTCGYRLVAAGKNLHPWHPLISGTPESVHTAGISVRGRCISERDAGPLEDHVIP
jgi:uncharacterized cysteine cluster protein YcgN (CxxCxxCC family)